MNEGLDSAVRAALSAQPSEPSVPLRVMPSPIPTVCGVSGPIPASDGEKTISLLILHIWDSTGYKAVHLPADYARTFAEDIIEKATAAVTGLTLPGRPI